MRTPTKQAITNEMLRIAEVGEEKEELEEEEAMLNSIDSNLVLPAGSKNAKSF